MKIQKKLMSYLPAFVVIFLFSGRANAEVTSAGLFDDVLNRYNAAASAWGGVITNSASWLFWLLVVISMVWTFGMMGLRKADISEFFSEFVKFTIFTGFYWWLLTNGSNFASSIFASLRQLAGNATGLGGSLSPSSIVDVGFEIFYKVMDQSSVWSPADSIAGVLMALVILVVLALVSVNMLLLLASGWILAYAGVFFLGFGGSRWTSEIAVNYYKTVLGVAAQLMGMVLLVGIGKTFLDDYYSQMSSGINLKEMGVLLIVTVILFALTNKVPQLLSGVITGASVGGAGIGQMGAGAALGAAGMAAAAAATGGAVLAAGAANAAGGAQAIMAAFSKASENVSSGSDIMSNFMGGGSNSEENASSTDSSAGSPFSQAAGFSAESATPTMDDQANEEDAHDDSGGAENSKGQSDSTPSDEKPQPTPSSGLMAGAAKAMKVAADAGANLAQGISDVAKGKAGDIRAAAKERIADTTGGRVAASIMGNDGKGSEDNGSAHEFAGNSLGGDNTAQENNSGKGGNASGNTDNSAWYSQTGGFSELSPTDQDNAREAHASWQAESSTHTFGVEDYVSYAQERNAEVANFSNKTA